MGEVMQLSKEYEESSEEQLSSEQSSGTCQSESAICEVNPRLVKSGTPNMIDHNNILVKFNRLTKRLKETSSNLLTVDHMMRYKGSLRLNKSETAFPFCNERYRRASSLPPSALRIQDCRLCSGDGMQNQRSHSVENLEVPQIMESVNKLNQMSQSLQDLSMSAFSKPTETKSPAVLIKKADPDTMPEGTLSTKGSESSLGDPLLNRHTDSSMTQSSQLSNMIVEELKSEVSTLKGRLNKLHLVDPFRDQTTMLYQQLQNKDKQLSIMSHHMQELTDKLDASEGQKHQLLLRLDDTLHTSLDVGTEAERFVAEMKKAEDMAVEAQAERDKLRKKAKKIIQGLRDKCKQHAIDLQQLRNHEWELEQRCNEYYQENGLLSLQITNLKEKVQEVYSELTDLKNKKEVLQKDFQQSELQLAEIKALHHEVHKNLAECKELNSKLLADNDASKSKLDVAFQEKAQLEIQQSALNKELEMLLLSLEEIKNELKAVKSSSNETQVQLLAESTIRQAVESTAHELSDKIKVSDHRLAKMQEKYMEAIGDHAKVTESLRQELSDQKLLQDQRLQEALKNNQKQYELRFTSLKLDLADNQAVVQTLQDSLKKEQEQKAQIRGDALRSKEEYSSLENKYNQLCKFYLMKKRKLQEKDQKINMLQQKLSDVHDMGGCLETHFKEILHLINDDIDSVADSVSQNSLAYPSVESNNLKPMQSQDWLVGIKEKLKWLKSSLENLPPSNEKLLPHHTSSMDSIHMFVQTPTKKSTSEYNQSTLQAKVPMQAVSPGRPKSAPSSKYWSCVNGQIKFSSPKYKGSKNQNQILQPPTLESLEYPFHSTHIKEPTEEVNESLIYKQYQKFQQVFDNVQAELDSSKIQLEPEIHEESSKACQLSTGHLSVTSSLSSISEFSCELGTTSAEQLSITNSIFKDRPEKLSD